MSMHQITTGPGSISYTFEAFQKGDETYEVCASFTMPRAERICVDGYNSRAIPAVEVTSSSTEIVRHWFFGGRSSLPDAVNAEVELLVREAMDLEHALAASAGIPPVPQEQVARHRAVDPDISVADIRRAMAIYGQMAAGTTSATTRTAVWIARNFVSNREHEDALAEAQDEADDAVQETAEPWEETRDGVLVARAESVLEAVETLRRSGPSVLQFRAGTSELEKVLDYLEDVA